MDCTTARERIVESFTDPLPPEISRALDMHCADCHACAAIVRQQHTLDTRLERLLVPGEMSRGFRRRLVRRAIEMPPRYNWSELLPDAVHLVSWGVATAAAALLLPISPSLTVGAGVGVGIASYFVFTIVRTSFEALLP